MAAADKTHPAIVMVDGQTGNKYMRLVDQKGLGPDKKMMWLVRDIHAELKAWGHPGGPGPPERSEDCADALGPVAKIIRVPEYTDSASFLLVISIRAPRAWHRQGDGKHTEPSVGHPGDRRAKS